MQIKTAHALNVTDDEAEDCNVKVTRPAGGVPRPSRQAAASARPLFAPSAYSNRKASPARPQHCPDSPAPLPTPKFGDPPARTHARTRPDVLHRRHQQGPFKCTPGELADIAERLERHRYVAFIVYQDVVQVGGQGGGE